MLYFLYLQGVPSLEQKLFKADISCDLFILGDMNLQYLISRMTSFQSQVMKLPFPRNPRLSSFLISFKKGNVLQTKLQTKCVGDYFEMLVTNLAVFVTKILYLLTLASGTDIKKMSPT